MKDLKLLIKKIKNRLKKILCLMIKEMILQILWKKKINISSIIKMKEKVVFYNLLLKKQHILKIKNHLLKRNNLFIVL